MQHPEARLLVVEDEPNIRELLATSLRYAGFDVMAQAIDWCKANIAVGDPRFDFVHADMHSDRYNPAGSQPASAFVFPYADASFDYVWLGSVFTHLLAADQAQFAREIARVLRPGGISIVSWYLIDDEARASRPGYAA